MAEHYTRGTECVLKLCRTCGRLTYHAVSAGRIGRCKEHSIEGESRPVARLARLHRFGSGFSGREQRKLPKVAGMFLDKVAYGIASFQIHKSGSKRSTFLGSLAWSYHNLSQANCAQILQGHPSETALLLQPNNYQLT